jgi:hypothetical protein
VIDLSLGFYHGIEEGISLNADLQKFLFRSSAVDYAGWGTYLAIIFLNADPHSFIHQGHHSAGEGKY